MQDFIKFARESGFTNAAIINPEEISFEYAEVFRDGCKANGCGNYGKYWTCPPAVGNVGECEKIVRSYEKGLILQLISEAVSLAFNEELFNELVDTFNFMTRELMESIRNQGYNDVYALGLNGCRLCEKCSYPKSPCRHPDKIIRCISSHSINAFELCQKCSLMEPRSDESELIAIILYK